MDASGSMPQGDPWSVLVLGLILRLPVLELQARFPRLHQVVYVDDRSWLRFGNFGAISSVLGFRENEGKSQFFHSSRAGRRRLRDTACADHVTHELTMLGMCISSSDERCTTDKERKREARALQVAAKCRYLHVNVARKAYISVGLRLLARFPGVGTKGLLRMSCLISSRRLGVLLCS